MVEEINVNCGLLIFFILYSIFLIPYSITSLFGYDGKCYCLDHGLLLLHPFMSYVTEELWQRLPQVSRNCAKKDSITISEYPSVVKVSQKFCMIMKLRCHRVEVDDLT